MMEVLTDADGVRALSKSTYTEEDLKKVLKTLFVERKKTQSLKEQLDVVSQEKQVLQTQLHSSEEKLSLTDSSLDEKLRLLQNRTQTQSEQHQKTLHQLKRTLQAVKIKYEQTIRDKETALKETKSSLEGLTRQNEKNQASQLDFEGQKEEYERLFESYTSIVEEKKQSEALYKSLKQEISQYKKDTDLQQVQLDRLMQQEHDAKSSAKAALKENEQLYKEVNKLKAVIEGSPSKLQEELKSLKEQNRQQKQQVDRFISTVEERDRQLDQLKQFEISYRKSHEQKRTAEKKVQEGKELVHSLQKRLTALESESKEQTENEKSLTEQLAQTENKYQDEKLQTNSLLYSLENLKQENQQALKKLENQTGTTQLLEERSRQLVELTREINIIKQSVIRGVRETKELEDHYLEAVSEKIQAMTLSQQVQQVLAGKEEELSKATLQLSDTQKQVDQKDSQIKELRNTLEQSQEYTGNLKQQLEAGKLIEEKLVSEQNRSRELEGKAAQLEGQVTEINEMRASLEKKKEDVSKFQDQVANLSAEVVVLEGVLDEKKDLEEHYDHLKDEYTHISNGLEDAYEQQKELSELKQALEKELEVGTLEKERVEESLKQALDSSKKEEKRAESLFQNREEITEQLQTLQQQFAKKVKENTVLRDMFDLERNKKADQDIYIQDLKGKIGEAEGQLHLRADQERRLQELLNESIKSAESQVGKWETKYRDMYEKWQKTETERKELSGMREKYHQVKKLLSNIGHFIGSPFALSASMGDSFESEVSEEVLQAKESILRGGMDPKKMWESELLSTAENLSSSKEESAERESMLNKDLFSESSEQKGQTISTLFKEDI